MQKVFLILFLAVILASSFVVSSLPFASALTARTDFSNRHSSASYGNSKVCGDHICKPGEQTQMMMKLSSSQRTGYGKVGTTTHGEDVIHNIMGSTPAPTTMHGNIKMTEKVLMAANMTDKGNVTKGTK